MNSRKGISPLIATVLLIAFTIAVGGIVSIWITSFTREQADTQTNRGDLASTCAGSAFFFSKNDVNVSGTTIKVIVSNEGSENQTDYDVYVLKTDGTFLSNTSPSGATTNQPGQKVQLTATMSENIGVNKTNLTSVTVTLGSADQCAGKSYKVDFP